MESMDTKLTREQILKLAKTIIEKDEYERNYQQNKKYKSEFRKTFAPIFPDGLYIQKWKPYSLNKNEIIGTWAEDGSQYIISCPYQIRHTLIYLQNILPELADLIENNISNKEKQNDS